MIRFYFYYYLGLLKWHLRLSRSRPYGWSYRHGKLWRASTEYHRNRKLLFGGLHKDPGISWTRQPGQLEMKYEYIQEGSAGNGVYLWPLPSKLKNGDQL